MRRTAADRAKNYKSRRTKLIAKLGGSCLDCGSKDNLQFDHKATRTWIARKTSRWMRIKLYEQEAKEGLIELRCKECNQRKGRPKDAPEQEDW